jgi:hypothetical protein
MYFPHQETTREATYASDINFITASTVDRKMSAYRKVEFLLTGITV